MTAPPRPEPEAGRVAGPVRRVDLDAAVGRLLIFGTYTAVGILALGVVAMIASGVGPGDRAPVFDVGSLAADVVALRPTGLLWLGLLAVIVTPIGRVVASLVGYARRGELSMVAVSVAILAVIALSAVLALTVES